MEYKIHPEVWFFPESIEVQTLRGEYHEIFMLLTDEGTIKIGIKPEKYQEFINRLKEAIDVRANSGDVKI